MTSSAGGAPAGGAIAASPRMCATQRGSTPRASRNVNNTHSFTRPAICAATNAVSTAMAGIKVEVITRLAASPVSACRLSVRPANRMPPDDPRTAIPAENHSVTAIALIDSVT